MFLPTVADPGMLCAPHLRNSPQRSYNRYTDVAFAPNAKLANKSNPDGKLSCVGSLLRGHPAALNRQGADTRYRSGRCESIQVG
jgi:hypothetical protein